MAANCRTGWLKPHMLTVHTLASRFGERGLLHSADQSVGLTLLTLPTARAISASQTLGASSANITALSNTPDKSELSV
jgi:hypothetical protein